MADFTVASAEMRDDMRQRVILNEAVSKRSTVMIKKDVFYLSKSANISGKMNVSKVKVLVLSEKWPLCLIH